MRAVSLLILAGSPVLAGDVLQPREVVALGPSGVCPPAPIVTVELQPVYCREQIPSTSAVYPIRGGDSFPDPTDSTTVCLATILTRTVSYASSTASSARTTISSLSTSLAVVSPSTTSSTRSTTTTRICPATGIAYAVQANNYVTGPSSYPNFEPAGFYNSTPLQQGVVDTFFLDANPNGALPGQPTIDFTQKAINLRGYLVARSLGVYTFTIPGNPDDPLFPDDIMALWIGNNAISGYTRANADAVVELNGASRSVLYTVLGPTLPVYIPFRVMAGNGPGALRYMFTITDPSNTVLVSSTVNGGDNLVQSCVALGVAEFPPFGMEGTPPP